MLFLHVKQAAVGNQIWCVQFLLENKADPNVKNNAGLLPEQLANHEKVQKLFESGDVVTVEVQVPRESHKRIIGQKGAKIQEIRLESGAQITVPAATDKHTHITLKGRPEAVAKAKQLILRVAETGFKIAEEGAFSGAAVSADPAAVRAEAAAANVVSVSVPVPKERHAVLLQPKTQYQLRNLIEQSGVQITVPAATSKDHIIVIRGPQDAVDQVVKRVFALTGPPAPGAASVARSKQPVGGASSSMSQARSALLRSNREDDDGPARGGARSSGGGGGGADGRRGAGAGGEASKNTVVLRNLSYDSTEESLRAALSSAGAITSVRLPTYPDTGKPRGIAFVEFAAEESLAKALALNGTDVDGRAVSIEVATARPARTDSDERPARTRSTGNNGGESSAPGPRSESLSAFLPKKAARGGERTGGGGGGGGSGDASVSSKNTVVLRNISFQSTEDTLRQAMASAGAVSSVRLPTYPDTGKPRGIAFVEFAAEESLAKALALNGTEVDGRAVTVEVASERAPRNSNNNSDSGARPARLRSAGTSDGQRRAAGGEASKNTVVLRNISFESTEDSLRAAMASVGAVSSVRLPTHPDSGKPRGIAFVEFAAEESLAAALALSGTQIDGRTVAVEVASERPARTNNSGGRGGRTNDSDAGGASPTPAPATASPKPAPAAAAAPASAKTAAGKQPAKEGGATAKKQPKKKPAAAAAAADEDI